MKINACQLRPRLGDIRHNVSLVLNNIQESGSEIIIFSELFLVGYPITDQFFESEIPDMIDQSIEQIKLASKSSLSLIVIGTPYFDGDHWRNAALAIYKGEVIHHHFKQCLPDYDIFNESRYFVAGNTVEPFFWEGKTIALLICEDIWADQHPYRYKTDPVHRLKGQPIDLVIHLTASPYEYGKFENRKRQVRRVAMALKTTVASVNQVGGYNDILFDGQSVMVNHHGKVITRFPAFKETVREINQPMSQSKFIREEIQIQAIEYGLKQYMAGSGFERVLVGLSGGIDSALVAALAVKAIGPEKVALITMPTQFNSKETKNDAIEMAHQLGCSITEFPIESYRKALIHDLSTAFNYDQVSTLTDQNLQARLRGMVLMAISNNTGALLLTTGNKSELAMGYATLYGDMCGGLNIIGDLFKTEVFELAKYLNQKGEWIPETIISRPPSAELAHNQADEDELPPYRCLDKILDELMIQKLSLNTIRELNDNNDVEFVLRRLKVMEYKRFQSPPILKLSSTSFGRGWQFPLIK
ncbi:MAG: NAD+ synthase [Candidatus Margulisiibacteriota bacterium]